jgi:hypothetical protein
MAIGPNPIKAFTNKIMNNGSSVTTNQSIIIKKASNKIRRGYAAEMALIHPLNHPLK